MKLGQRRQKKSTKIDSLIGRQTELIGDVRFTGGLYVDGKVQGNVLAEDDSNSFLTLSEHGSIEGEVVVPNVQLNGTVVGDVRAADHIELAANARISGNVYYRLIEIAMGAEVNGNLVHIQDDAESQLKLRHEPPVEPPREAVGRADPEVPEVSDDRV